MSWLELQASSPRPGDRFTLLYLETTAKYEYAAPTVAVPTAYNRIRVWGFMYDGADRSRGFRTFNVIDESSREAGSRSFTDR